MNAYIPEAISPQVDNPETCPVRTPEVNSGMEKIVDAIHIGFQRAASTFVQKAILSNHPGIFPVGKGSNNLEYRKLITQLLSCDEYDFSLESVREEFLRLNDKFRKDIPENAIRVLSHEYLCGNVYTGANSKQMAERIYSTFGVTRIVIVIREQISMMESLYRYYIQHGGVLRIQEFLYSRRSPGSDPFGDRKLFSRFRYDNIIRHYQELFGKENVSVLLYEDLERGGEIRFGVDFLNAIGVRPVSMPSAGTNRVNSSISYYGAVVGRIFNKLIPTDFNEPLFWRDINVIDQGSLFRKVFRLVDDPFLGRVFPDRQFTEQKAKWLGIRVGKKLLQTYSVNDDKVIAQDIRDAYRESNGRTSELIGVDLGKYGYAV